MQAGKIHLYCGDGKGKTTAAMGLALRAVGAGKRVVILQFLKDGASAEIQLLKKFEGVTVYAQKACEAFVWNMTEQQKQQTRELHDSELEKALAQNCDVLILDEICSAYAQNLVDTDKVRSLIMHKPAELELVLTGRDPAAFMIDRADYMTEMMKKKHPFDEGVPARLGIEF